MEHFKKCKCTLNFKVFNSSYRHILLECLLFNTDMHLHCLKNVYICTKITLRKTQVYTQSKIRYNVPLHEFKLATESPHHQHHYINLRYFLCLCGSLYVLRNSAACSTMSETKIKEFTKITMIMMTEKFIFILVFCCE